MKSAGALFRTPVGWGALLWLVLLWMERPDAHHDLWARLLLLLAVLVSFSGWGIAFGYIRAWRQEKLPFVVCFCWGIMAVCLLFSMTLSFGYALRFIWPTGALSLPAMRALHGTLNAFGVAGGGLLGWCFLNLHDVKTNLR